MKNTKPMNTATLNSEIFWQLSLIADNENFLSETLSFLKKLTNTQCAAMPIAKRGNYATLLRQLSDYQELQANWDGEGALPLEQKSTQNLKKILEKTEDRYLNGWHIEPDTNGTILLVSDDGISVINIGNETFSFYTEKAGQFSASEARPFSQNEVIDLLKEYKDDRR